MKKWIVRWDAGFSGTDCYGSCLAETKEEAEEMFEGCALEHVNSYSYLFNDDQALEDATTEVYEYAEKYDPKKHDKKRCGGTKWVWE